MHSYSAFHWETCPTHCPTLKCTQHRLVQGMPLAPAMLHTSSILFHILHAATSPTSHSHSHSSRHAHTNTYACVGAHMAHARKACRPMAGSISNSDTDAAVTHKEGQHPPGKLPAPGTGSLKLRALTSSGLSCSAAATCSTMFSMMRMPGKSPGPLQCVGPAHACSLLSALGVAVA